MVEKLITTPRNVVDFARYQQDRKAAILARVCRHCGAALSEGESEDECSSAFNLEAPGLRSGPRKFYAD
jgi:hypothetical protein